jgi:hypothetical protein
VRDRHVEVDIHRYIFDFLSSLPGLGSTEPTNSFIRLVPVSAIWCRSLESLVLNQKKCPEVTMMKNPKKLVSSD